MAKDDAPNYQRINNECCANCNHQEGGYEVTCRKYEFNDPWNEPETMKCDDYLQKKIPMSEILKALEDL